MKHNITYETYHNSRISDVPLENLKILVTVFIENAALTLGCKATKADVDKVSEFVSSNQFNFLPVEIAASAFSRGALGKLKNDKTTLSPRNIYDWLSEISLEYRQNIEHKERDERLSKDISHFTDLDKYPLGKAICWKIDRMKSGAMDSDDWDNIPLKAVAEMIGRGGMPTLEDFGIESKTI